VTTGNTLTIQQTTEQAILNWSSFNVSADGTVIFKQPDSSAIALNRIFQASPSQIFGLVQANGQVYLINQNGFVFGPTARVNVGGLLASTLQLSDATFSAGLLTPILNNEPALQSDGRTGVLDSAGKPVLGSDGKPLPVQIVVQPGAQLSTAADGERILLVGQSVLNGGQISAPNGQVILAAGQSLYLQASTDPALRGLIVEVDGGGLTANQLQGQINVAEGNVSLVGLAVNQLGRISATTSVSANGSIQLIAEDKVTFVPNATGGVNPAASEGGTLTLGPQSQTQVLPDTASTATAVDEQAQLRSSVTLGGQHIELTGGSSIVAPSGQVSITASSTPANPNNSESPDPDAHLRIDPGATIDVSGSTTSVPVTRNLVTVQLRGSELADDPLQRDGALRGQTVVVDARVGTPLADVSGELALIQRGILERTSTGGSVVLDSGGDVVVEPGALINVSGGKVIYTPGTMQTSLLTRPDGSTVPIGSASPDQVYTGVVNPSFKSVSNQWGVIQFIPTPGIAHYDPGYTQGMSAGSISVLGNSLVLDGQFVGQAVNGIYQRSGSGMALGGSFTVGLPASTGPADLRAPAVQFVNQLPPISVDPTASLPSGVPLELSTSLLSSGGFSRIQIASNDRISVPSGVDLTLIPGGSITLQAPAIDVDAPIRVPGGSIKLIATASGGTVFGTPGLGVFVGDGTTLDVSGMWTNDLLVPADQTPSGAALTNAGSIQLTQGVLKGTLSLGSDVNLIANGGAQLNRGGSLTAGTGGSIALVAQPGGSLALGDRDSVSGFGVEGAAGGSFTLEAPRIAIGSGDTTWERAQTVSSDPNSTAVLNLDASLFSNFGFQSFALTADGPRNTHGASQDVLSVLPDTQIDLLTRTLSLDPNASTKPSGNPLVGLSTVTLLPQYLRQPTKLALQAVTGDVIGAAGTGNLTIGAGSLITADPGSSFQITSLGSLLFDGSLNAPSATVNLAIAQPDRLVDPGYVASLRIELGPQADIDVAGTALYKPSDSGLLSGTVLPGGTVTLSAVRGSILTDVGSVIDFSGTQAPIDIPLHGSTTATTREVVASAGGALSFTAPETISLLGRYVGTAGEGTTGDAPAGTLNVTLHRDPTAVPVGNGFPTAPAIITLQSGPISGPLAAASGSAVLDVNQLAASGVDALNLTADAGVRFTDGVQLNLARSLSIETPAIILNGNATATVQAPYIALGTAGLIAAAAPALPGTGSITFSGNAVDLIGALAFQGVQQATIASTGEILLRGEQVDFANKGSLAIAGDLTLAAARVVPTTDVSFAITAAKGATNLVQFEQTGSLSGTPLSVGGSLTVTADDILQAGTIYAPFGELTFAARNGLTFAPGSLTSVSGSGNVLPYGRVDNGTDWVYQVAPNQLVPTSVTAVPTRQVALSGATVTIQNNATVDVSGGGDLYAYGFTPGTGGTKDALSPTVSPGLYAIVPSLAGQFAPYDPMMWLSSAIAPNQSVYLSGGGGIPAGVYPLLPARYALLPGAYLISVASGFQDLQPGTSAQASDGSPIVSGYFTFGNTGLGDTRYSGFVVRPGSYAGQLADYSTSLASTFFANPPSSAATSPSIAGSLPADGGTLLVSVQQAFNALGKVDGSADKGGEGAVLEISAPQIVVDPTPSAAAVPGQIHLATSVLDSWNAGRIWIGGQMGSTGSVSVTASSVEVTAGSNLIADEIVLLAQGGIQIDSGATVSTHSVGTSSSMPEASAAAPTQLTLNGTASASAVLAVSDLAYWVPNRTGTSPASSAALVLQSGATVGSRGALTLDAPAGGTLADGDLVGPGAQWSIGANNVVFAAQGSSAKSFVLDDALLSSLATAGTVRIASNANPITVSESVALGAASGSGINEVDLVSSGLLYQSGDAFNVTAGRIALTGGSGTGAAPIAGSGTATFTAREVDFDGGNFGLVGFSTVTLDGSDAIVGSGAGTLATAGNLNLLAPLVTTQNGAVSQLSAAGALTLNASSRASSGLVMTPGVGGSLQLTGSSVLDGTVIQMPSGEVSLQAAQQLQLTSAASLMLAGLEPANATHGSDGGALTLTSGADLSVASGVSINVAAAPGANAGSIAIVAGGIADFEASAIGSGFPGLRPASFSLQAQSIPNFASLNDALESGGFHGTRAIRVGSGDLNLAAGAKISAQDVELTADQGSINIAGAIDISNGTDVGQILLSARNDVVLTSSAVLGANATAGGVAGGVIELSSTTGSVRLDSNAQVAASGAGQGVLLVRAPVSPSGTDVNITSLPSDLTHVDTVVLEPIITTSLSTTPSTSELNQIGASLSSFMAAASPVITARLGGGASNVVVRPYADLTSPGAVTLSSYDFSTWRFTGQPPDVSIRAGGAITVSGTLSDGFNDSQGFPDILSGPSASLSLVAGADLSSASARAVTANGSDLTLAPGAIIRTGTGGIELAAARDITFGTGASIYTGGVQGGPTTTNTDTGVPLAFPTNGGDIRIDAGRDLTGALVVQPVDLWNPQFQPNVAAIWGVDFSAFGWNVGALGGGDVVIHAGRNAVNVSAAVADSRTFAPDGVTSIALGGGNLTVTTGGDISTGMFYVGKGIGQLDAGGALSNSFVDSFGRPVATLLLAGDASYSVSAQRNVLLQGELSATALAPSGNADPVNYFRYGPTSALTVQSRGGSLTYQSVSLWDLPLLGGTVFQSDAVAFQSLPGAVDLAAFGGDVTTKSTLQLAPAASGQLSIYAGRDLVVSQGTQLIMLDEAASLVATADSPSFGSAVTSFPGLLYTSASVHAADPVPVSIAAGRDILGLQVQLAKQADVSAGRDIVNLIYQGQNLNPNDLTAIRAGRDITYTPDATTGRINLSGPGQLEVIAGRNISLGYSQGITTFGNLLNPDLATAEGAAITVLAGLGAPIGIGGTGSANDYVSKIIGASPTYQQDLVSYTENLTGESDLSFDAAAQSFRDLPLTQQLPLIDRVFFAELTQSGQEANQVPSAGFGRGYSDIDSLFPGSRSSSQPSPDSGDLTLGYSRIYTLAGGSISLLVPGGGIDVGLTNPPPVLSAFGFTRSPSQLGVVAVGSGDVDIFSNTDVLVNESRVFTLGGGNIVIWSTTGNIDAGRGAKTALSAPPPTIEVDSSGNVSLDFSAAVAGSGIRTIQSFPDVPAGNVDLIAPVGFVNAGDAGIGAAGNINIAAQRVLGAANINFGGTATGVPPEVSGIGASLSAASAVASSATSASSGAVAEPSDKAGSKAPIAESALSWLDVFVEGFGQDVCKADDVACLARQRSHAQ
jgi:filamentous hemagglutinin family protein